MLSTQDQILFAAHELFAERGVAGVSLRDIALRVDLHNSTLLHHFENKQELARRVFDAVAEAQLSLLAPLEAGEPGLEELVEALGRIAAHLQRAPAEARILARALAGLEPGLSPRRRGAPLRRLGGILEGALAAAARSATSRPQRPRARYSPCAWPSP